MKSALAAVLACFPLLGQPDWPQFGGPNRNFHVHAPDLIVSFASSGPKVLWSRPLGEGYSQVTVADGTLYTMYLRGNVDVTAALDAKTGKTLWEHAIPRETNRTLDLQFGKGPHTTPLVTGGLVYTVGTTARLVALEAKTGRLAWQHDLWREFQGAELDRGYAASPVAYKDTLILPVGGSGRALMAFRMKDGSVAWQRGDYKGTFSSPFFFEVGGLHQLGVFFGDKFAAFNADNGDPQWDFPHKTDYDLNIAPPVIGPDGIAVLSSAYSGGARGLQLTVTGTQTRARQIWTQRKFRVHHSNLIRLGDYVYGSSGDFGPAPLTCVNVRTGAVAWQDRALGKVSILWTGRQAILLSEEGEIGLAELTPQGLKIKARASLLKSNAWTSPSLAGGILYARDRHTLMAVDLRQP